jgi:hypothetical protein
MKPGDIVYLKDDPAVAAEERTAAAELCQRVCTRLKVDASRITCPREKSEWTPCVVRDAELAVDAGGECVGCGLRPSALLELERAR